MSYLDEICNNYIIFEKDLNNSKNLDEFAKCVKDKYSLLTKHLAKDMSIDSEKIHAFISYGKIDRFFEIVGEYDVLENTRRNNTFNLSSDETLGIEKYLSCNRLFNALMFISADFAYLDLAEENVEKRIETRDVSVIENMRKSFLEKYLN